MIVRVKVYRSRAEAREPAAWSGREGRYLTRAEWDALPWWKRWLGWAVRVALTFNRF